MSAGEHVGRTGDAYPLSKGYLFPAHDVRGVVHSVFRTVCNIAVDDLLLTVQDSATPHTPTSVRVGVTGGGVWSPIAAIGECAAFRSGVLSFGRHSLDLARLPVWTPEPATRWAHTEAARRRLAQVAEARNEHLAANAPDAAVPSVEGTARAVRVLLVPTQRTGIGPVAVRLVGVGPGLTPAGDDVLVGLMTALFRGAHGLPPLKAAFTQICTAVLAHLDETTEISAHHLRLAARGHAGEPLTDLVDAIVGGAPTQVLARRTDAVLNVGATSGADAVLGVLVGLDAALDLVLDGSPVITPLTSEVA